MITINSFERLLNYVGSLSKQDIENFPEFSVNEWVENGNDLIQFLSIAKKGEELFSNLLSLLNKNDVLIREVEKYKTIQRNGIKMSIHPSVRYDYSNSPAIQHYSDKIKPFQEKIKELETVAKRISVVSFYTDEETGEQLTVYPAEKKVTEVVKCVIIE